MRKRSSRLPPLNGLRAFEAAARHLTSASRPRSCCHAGCCRAARAQPRGGSRHQALRQAASLARLDHSGARLRRPSTPRFRADGGGTSALRPELLRSTISVTPTFASKWLIRACATSPPRTRKSSCGYWPAKPGELPVRRSRRRRAAGSPAFGPGLVADLLLEREVVAVCSAALLPETRRPLATGELERLPPTRCARSLARVRRAGLGAITTRDDEAGPLEPNLARDRRGDRRSGSDSGERFSGGAGSGDRAPRPCLRRWDAGSAQLLRRRAATAAPPGTDGIDQVLAPCAWVPRN